MSTPLISVLLPTVRPNSFQRSVDSIGPAVDGLSHEVIIVADFWLSSMSGPRKTRWIGRERRGPVHAVNEAVKFALGEYWFLFNDEAVLEPGALNMLYRASIDEPGALFAPVHSPPYTFQYYGKPFVPFPFAHRGVFTKLGGLLDGAYRAFYADPDLGLRAHAAGVAIRTVEGSVIRHYNGHDEAKQGNVSQYMALDQRTFRDRWDHLGEFHDC